MCCSKSVTSLIIVSIVCVFTSNQARSGVLFSNFSSVSGLTLNGDAHQIGTAIRISNSSLSSSGSFFTTSSTSLGNLNSFSTFFQFQITNPGNAYDSDGPGADGIAFVVQTVNNSVGHVGGGIGYGGIAPSVAVEFDTWDNGSLVGDPSGNHVAIAVNGDLGSPRASLSEATRFNNGSLWNAWIDFNGTTKQLDVRWGMSNNRPLTSMISANVDLVSILGQNTAFLGFTSATGAGFNDHDILSWEYRDEFNPIGNSGGVVPEPSSLLIFGLGLVSIGFVRIGRRRSR